MGNRAIVRFPDDTGGVEIYLHWDADNVRQWLIDAAPNMRRGNAGYAAARFIAYCAANIPGGLSLGVYPLGSCGDGVIFSVDCSTGKVKAPGGKRFSISMGNF